MSKPNKEKFAQIMIAKDLKDVLDAAIIKTGRLPRATRRPKLQVA